MKDKMIPSLVEILCIKKNPKEPWALEHAEYGLHLSIPKFDKFHVVVPFHDFTPYTLAHIFELMAKKIRRQKLTPHEIKEDNHATNP